MPWLRLSPERCPAQAAVLPARGPLCGLFRANLAESCAGLRATFRLVQGFLAALERGLGDVGAGGLGANPGFGVCEQPAHLVEQHGGRGAARLELLDSLQPVENRPCLVHDPKVAGKDAPVRDVFVTIRRRQLAIDCTPKKLRGRGLRPSSESSSRSISATRSPAISTSRRASRSV